MPTPSTLIEALQLVSRSLKGITFVNSADDNRFISYKALYENALNTLGNLQSLGLKKGDRVLLYLDDNQKFLEVFWGCVLGGIIPVPLAVGNQDMHRLKILKVWKCLRPCKLLTTETLTSSIEKYLKNQSSSFLHLTDDILKIEEFSHFDKKGKLAEISRDDIAFLQFTSGSTGNPKGVILTHENLVVNVKDIISVSHINEEDQMLSWMPLTHDMGLICFHLSSMFANSNQYLMPTNLFIRRPVLWLSMACEFGVTILYSPNFGLEYFLSAFKKTSDKYKHWNLNIVRLIYNGAEPISFDLCSRFQKTLFHLKLKENVIFPGYGMAEASVAVTLSEINSPVKRVIINRDHINIGEEIQYVDEDFNTSVSFVTVGKSIPNSEVIIVDDQENKLGDKRVGHVRIKGKNVTQGYYNNQTANQALFNKDGWLITGDLGFMIDGELVITGRFKNLIIVNGQNYYHQDLEEVLMQINEIGLGKVVVCGLPLGHDAYGKLVVFVLFKKSPKAFKVVEGQVRKLMNDHFGLIVHHVVPVRKIPKTTSGKIQNFQLLNLYLDGEYESILKELYSINNLNEDNTDEEVLRHLLRIHYGILEIGRYDSLLSHGINSIQSLNLASEISDKFGVSLGVSELFRNDTLYAILTLIRKLKKGNDVPVNISIEKAPVAEYYLLSPELLSIYHVEQVSFPYTPYNISVSYKVSGKLDIDILNRACRILMRRHSMLTARFYEVNDKAVFTYDSSAVERFQVLTKDGFSSIQEIRAYLEDLARQRFDLNSAPLFKVAVIQSKTVDEYLLLNFHHLIVDGWSVKIYQQELAHIYSTIKKGGVYDEERVQHGYEDYLLWELNQQSDRSFIESSQYWSNELLNLPKLDFYLAKKRPKQFSFKGASIYNELTGEQTNWLRQLSREQEGTLFVTVIAALTIVFSKYSGKEEIVVGTDTSGRLSNEFRNQIGYFLKTLAIRTEVDFNSSFKNHYKAVKNKTFEALNNQAMGINGIQGYPSGRNDISRAPHFDVLILMQNFGESIFINKMDEETTLSHIDLVNNSSLLDLCFEFFDLQNKIAVKIHYNPDLFSEEYVKVLLNKFQWVVKEFANSPSGELLQLDFADKKDKEQISKKFNDKIRKDKNHDVLMLIQKCIRVYPENPCLNFNGNIRTYQEFGNATDQVALALVNEKSLEKGCRVGVFMDRSEKQVVYLIALMKVGATFVPMDVDFPDERLKYIVQDANLDAILCERQLSEKLNSVGCSKLIIDNIDLCFGKKAKFDEVSNDGEDFAYINYTSGTTGKPKGVAIARKSLADYVISFSKYFDLSETDKIIYQSSLSFDTAYEEIFPALSSGCELIISAEGGKDVPALLDLINVQKATLLSTTPLVLDLINRQRNLPTSLRIIISGGDKLLASNITSLFKTAKIYNTYGPTEGTICVTYYPITSLDDVDVIGKPLPNKNVYIVDEEINLLPVGVAGQIAISGIGLAKGYLKNSTLTDKYFISNPFDDTSKLYLTGDQGYWREDGNIVFLGRKDYQIKISGKRVELEEIAQQIMEVPGISNCVVKYFSQTRSGLVAFYEAEKKLASSEIRGKIKKSLPEYMIPKSFVQIDRMPLTQNGKLDPSQLTEDLVSKDLSVDPIYVIATKEEKTILEIWEEVLGLQGIGPEDNFFELGGYSLKANEFLIALYEKTGVKITFAEFFKDASPKALAHYLKKTIKSIPFPSIEPAKMEKTVSIGNAEKRFWVIDQFQKDKRSYTLNWYYEIEGPFDITCFREAFAILIEKYDILRTSYMNDDGDIYRNISTWVPVNSWYTYTDLSNHEFIEARIDDYEAEIRDWEFDLAQAPLFRMQIIKIANAKFRVYLAIHHIICDGYSMELLAAELSETYNRLRSDTYKSKYKNRVEYSDFVAWQNKVLSSGFLDDQMDYWHNQINPEDNPVELPIDYQRPSIQTYNGTSILVQVPDSLYHVMQQGAKRNRVTTFSYLLSVFKLLLHRYTGAGEVQVGMVTANRDIPGTEHLIGLLLNTIVINTKIEKDLLFVELLEEVNRQLSDALDHQHYPFELLVDQLVSKRDLSRSPLFNIMVGYQNRDKSEFHMRALSDLTVKKINVGKNASQFDLSVDFIEEGNQLSIEIEYNSDLYDIEKIEALGKHFLNLLKGITEDDCRPLSVYTFLKEEELQSLTRREKIGLEHIENSFPEVFQNIAIINAENLAVSFGDEELTYLELDELSDLTASNLYYEFSLINQPVGIIFPKSINAIVMILALLKNGCPYVPIDNDSPIDRTNHIIEQSNLKYIITDRIRDGLKNETMQLTPDLLLTGSKRNIDKVIQAETAYIAFTSGSTGMPKGVKVTHKNLLSASYSWTRAYNLSDRRPIVLQLANMAFDVFSGDLCRALLNGGELVLCTREQQLDFEQLYNLMERKGITIMESTPSLCIPFIKYMMSNNLKCQSLQMLILGSEAISTTNFVQIDRYFGDSVRVVNSFGTTETTIDSAFFEGKISMDFTQHTPIGRALDNTCMFILDQYLNVLPVGYDGELAIGGSGVAQGYINDPRRTSERFVKIPSLGGQRVYRTGDQARLLKNGDYVFLGRLDNQVKIRGHRVELGEIEAVALQYDGVDQAIVLADEFKSITRLILYTNPKIEERADFLSFLNSKLPSYMIPTYLIGQSERFKVTNNGKIDRKSLQRAKNTDYFIIREYETPLDGIETVLEQLWCMILEIPQVGRQDNFFELGGDSIKATKLIGLLAKEHQLKLTFEVLFRDARLKAIAKELKEVNLKRIPKTQPSKTYPLSTAQRSIWLLEQSADVQGSYNMPVVYQINGIIDVHRIKTAFQRLVDKYDILRSVVVLEANVPRLRIKSSEESNFALKVEYGNEKALKSQIKQLNNYSFGLNGDLLIQAKLFFISENHCFLLVNLHHIISDGWSVGIMTKELSNLYQQHALNKKPLTIQYQDFSTWQHRQLREGKLKTQQSYWFKKLANSTSPQPIAGDFKRPPKKTFKGRTMQFQLHESINDQIKSTAQNEGVTYFTVLISAVRALLFKYTNHVDCIIGTATSGRGHVDLADQLGCFVNTLPLYIPLKEGESFKALLFKAKNTISEAQSNSDYPFDQLIDDLNLDRNPSRSPLFDVMVVLQNTPDSGQKLNFGDDLIIQEYPLTRSSSKYYLTFNFEDSGADLNVEVEYNTDIFKRSRIEDITRHLDQLIRALLKNIEDPITEVAYLSKTELNSNMLMGPVTSRSKDVIEVIRDTAHRNPEKIALIWPNGHMSYGRLMELSTTVSSYLDFNQLPDCVGIDVSRSWQTVVAILGVVQSGRAYVPVSLNDPKDRLSHQLKETKVDCILSAENLIQGNTSYPAITVEEIISNFKGSNTYDVPKQKAGQIIYILYTSGSTGKPKGARVYRDSFNDLVSWYEKELGLSEESNVLLLAPPTFDLCQKNIFTPLCAGGTLALPGGESLDFIDLADHLENWKIDTVNCAPSTFYPLLEQAEGYDFCILRYLSNLVLGGESINLTYFEKWRNSDYFNVRIMNSYGPTECTDVVCFHWLKGFESNEIPIGLPIPNAKLYVLDDYNRILPAGNIGKLFIGGGCLGGGYVDPNLPDQEKFINGTAEISDRLYRTGDKAYIGKDGLLYFHGRVDDQVKLNGYRIELGEIEQAILKITGKERVVAKIAKDHQRINEVIVCYLETKPSDKDSLYHNLKDLLPGYMMPSYLVVQSDGFKLNRNGKIDRKGLREVTEADLLGGGEYVEPLNTLERQVADIWKEVLSLNNIGREDDFFTIGGTSLKALQVVSLIHQKYGLKSSLGDILGTSRLKDFCKTLKQEHKGKIQASKRTGVIPLSPAQQGLWHLVQVEDALEAYNMSACYKIEGPINIGLLNDAANHLLERHDILRTTIDLIDDLPRQIIHPYQKENRVALVPVQDDLERQLSLLSAYQFDLSHGPLIKITLLQVNDQLNYLHFNTHHLIADGYSINLIINEYCEFYNGNSEYFNPLEIQYSDYSRSQTAFEKTKFYEKALAYWKEKFNLQLPILDLPTDHTRPSLKTYHGKIVERTLGNELISSVHHLIKGTNRTLFEFFLSCLIGVLHRYTAQRDFVIGIPVSSRNQAELLNQIGYYVNTIAHLSQMDVKDTFNELFDKTKKNWNEDLKHSEVPFHTVVENLKSAFDRSRSPLFDVMLVYNDEPVGVPNLKGLNISKHKIVEDFAKYDLTFNIYKIAEGFKLEIEYNTDLYAQDRIEQLAMHFIGFAEEAVKVPDQPVAAIKYYDESLLHLTWPTPTLDDSVSFDLIDEFEKTVLRVPKGIALKWAGGSMSYTELNWASNKIADQILRSSSAVQPIVAVSAERSPLTIIAILGILKAGAAYLPISTDLPIKRKKYMLAIADVDIYFTISQDKQIHNEQWVIEKLLEDEGLISENKGVERTGKLIYILFTSGSTGEPKGARVTRKAFNNLLSWYIDELALDQNSTSLLIAPLSFDLAQKNIFANLCSGGTLVLPESGYLNYMSIVALLEKFKVTHINCAPAAFYPIIELLIDSGFEPIRSLVGVVLGGESITTSKLLPWLKSNPEVKIMNSYGPTECTDVVSYHWLTEENILSGQVPIGVPIPNAELLLLDSNGIPVPAGCIGEIGIMGLCVGIGYIGDVKLTRAKFKRNEVLNERLVYGTGDMGRLLKNGTIQYLGRNDNQVKVNGKRIEPGEIESVLQEFPEVQESLVLVQSDSDTRTNRLVAYVVPGIRDRVFVKSSMTKVLPDFMIPSYVVELPHGFPLNSHGKIDRSNLPSVTEHDLLLRDSYDPPVTATEVTIAEIWKKLFGDIQIGRTSNFFQLGGDSIKAVRFLSDLKKLDMAVSQTLLFANPILKDLANEVKRMNYNPILPIEEKLYYQLSSAQRGLWLLMQSVEDIGAYNIPAAFRIKGAFNVDRFCDSFSSLVRDHEALRTIFVELDGYPYQSILEPEHPGLEIEVKYENDQGIDDLIQRLSDERFNLATGPLFSARLVQLSSDEFVFLFNIHHLISDGWSLGLMMDELTQRYNGRQVERLPIQYKDFSSWEYSRKNSIQERELGEFWDEHLSGALPVFDFPTKRPRGNIKTFDGETIKKQFSDQLVANANMFCRNGNITLPALMLASLRILLYRYTFQNDIIIGVPDSGRRHPDLERQLGFYVNTLPLRSKLKESETSKEVVEAIRETLIQCQNFSDLSLDLIIERLALPTNRSRSPLFDVVFVFQNTPYGDSELNDLSDLTTTKIEIPEETSKFDLTFSVTVAKNIVVELTYNNYLYEHKMMEQLLEHFEEVIHLVIENFEKPTTIRELDFLSSASSETTIPDVEKKPELPLEDFIASFERNVENMPKKTALLWESGTMSFEALNAKANKIAHYLDQSDAPEVIAIESQRNWEMIVATLGVLKSDRSYLPIDGQLPSERISHMLAESCAALFISTGKGPVHGSSLSVKEILADGQLLESNPNRVLNQNDQIYILYTSGSTGLPKGARVKRSSFNNLLSWYIVELNLDEHSKMVLLAPPSFDTCQKNLFANITVGGQLFLPGEGKIDYYDLIDKIKQHQISELNCAPAAFYPILEITAANHFEQLASLRSVVLGGESIKLDLFISWKSSASFNAEILNIYGPTECTDVVSCHWVDEDDFKNGVVPIGHPIKNVELHVLDKNGDMVPDGCIGEIYITGECISDGYVGGLNNHAFCKIGERYKIKAYKTGDLGRKLPNGELLFLGRIDHQIKLNGQRIESAEIEQVAQRYKEGGKAIVQFLYDELLEREVLICYVDYSIKNREDFRTHLSSYLPVYMIPTYLVEVPNGFKLNTNGKVDRKQLPFWTKKDLLATRVFEAPKGNKEKLLKQIFQELLNAEEIGRNESFFELGGDSLKALQIVARLREKGWRANVETIFKSGSIRLLAKRLTPLDKVSDQRIVTGKQQLSPIQKFFFNQFEKFHHFNQSVVLVFKERLNETAFSKALTALVNHHDTLRMRFPLDGTQQFEITAKLDISDYVKIISSDVKEEITSFGDELQSSLNIKHGPAWRIGLIQGEREDTLIFVIHHLLVDGVSWRILLSDLETAYKASVKNETIKFSPKTDSFISWVKFVNSSMNEKSSTYWRSYLGQTSKIEQDIKENKVADSSSVTCKLNRETTQTLLQNNGKKFGASITELLVASFFHCLQQKFPESPLSVMMEGHGRPRNNDLVEFSRTVGWFTSLYPLDIKVDKEITGLLEMIRLVKDRLREIPDEGRYFLSSAINHGLNKVQFPKISFNYLGQFDDIEQSELFTILAENYGNTQALDTERLFQWDVIGIINKGEMEFTIEYNGIQHSEEQMSSFITHFKVSLDSLVSLLENNADMMTPTDFTYSNLKQSELEMLTSSYDVQDIWPLTAMQVGMYYQTILEEKSDSYFVQINYRLQGNISVEHIQNAYTILVTKHPALRSTFLHKGIEQPIQLVVEKIEPQFSFSDLTGLTDINLVLEEVLEEDRELGFDFEKPGLIRLKILKVGVSEYQFIWSYHHLILDGWSLALLTKEFYDLNHQLQLGDKIKGSEPSTPVKYFDWLKNQNYEQALGFWKEYFDGYDTEVGFVTNFAKYQDKGKQMNELIFDVSQEMVFRLTGISNENSVTDHIVLKTLWGILISKYLNRNDVVFGEVSSIRPEGIEAGETMIGMFINTIAARICYKPESKFENLIKSVHRQSMESTAYRYVSASDLNVEDKLVSNLIDHIFVFQNYPFEESSTVAIENYGDNDKDLYISGLESKEYNNFDLLLVMTPGNQWQLKVQFDESKLSIDFIETLVEDYFSLFSIVGKNTKIPIGDIKLEIFDENKSWEDQFNESF